MWSATAEVDLVRRALDGDRCSVDTLMEEVRSRILARIRRVTFDADCAEDLVQETLLAIVRSMGRLRQVDRFWPWAMSIAVNKVRQHYRCERRRPAVQLSVLDMAGLAGRAEEPPVFEPGSSEAIRLLLAGLSGAAGRHRAVLEMRYFERMPYAAIANRLGCTETSARVAVFRAKRVLRRELRRFGLTPAALLAA